MAALKTGVLWTARRNLAPDLGEQSSHARNNLMGVYDQLPYRQGRLLRRVDRALRRSDPDLASMLSIFARLTAAESMPAQEQLRPRRLTWARRVLLWPVAAALFLVVFAVGEGSSAAAARGAASRRCASENREAW